jgi:F-type H+-transporting ATPase subunit gamma
MNGMRRVTSTMQMVAASHLHRMQRELTHPLAYGKALKELLQRAAYVPSFAQHRLMGGASPARQQSPAPAKPVNILLIVMGSDRGLCGSFNHGIAVTTRHWVEEQRERRDIAVETVYAGQKVAHLLARELPSASPAHTFPAHPKSHEMAALANAVMDRFMKGEVDEVWLSGSRFVNTLRHDDSVRQLVPFAETVPPDTPYPNLPQLEPEDPRTLETLMRQWVRYRLFTAQQHRLASEHASRMVAMSSATDNLTSMEKDLKLRRNRARQAAITSELIEIIAGAESLA